LRNFSILANLCQPKIELRVDLIIRLLGFSIKSGNVETNTGKKMKKAKKRRSNPRKQRRNRPKKI
jgi:hypothetical protein